MGRETGSVEREFEEIRDSGIEGIIRNCRLVHDGGNGRCRMAWLRL